MQNLINKCDGCDLCCRKYRIYLYPSGARRIAKKLNLKYKDFVNQYLDFYFEFFDLPTGFSDTEFIPTPENILNKRTVLFPILSIKQKDGACMFLENHKCKIYNQRPLICQLFPQLKLGNEKNDFCKLDSTDNDHVNRKLYYPVLKNYLSDLKKYGFKDTWKYLPEFKKENIYIIHNSEKIDQDQKIFEWLEKLL